MKLSVFLHDGRIYASPTRTSFPPQGPPSIHDDSQTSTHVSPPASTWHRCMWAKRDYLEMAFFPSSTLLAGELFRHLRFYRKGAAPLEERWNPGQALEYRISHAEELYKLECLLVQVRNILQDEVGVLVGPYKGGIAGPSTESYREWSRDRESVQHRAFFVRKKFLYHIAMISFHIAIIAHGTGDNHRWYSLLLKNQVPALVADKLSSTMLADFGPNVSRAGAFILPDQHTASWISYVRVLIFANVPVYVAWGPVGSSPPILKAFEQLYPPPADIERALKPPPAPDSATFLLTGDDSFESGGYSRFDFEDSSAPMGGNHDPSLNGQFYWKGRPLLSNERSPYLPKFSSSDTPGSFFSRRAAAREHYIATMESPNQKAARLEREEAAYLYLVPDQQGDDIYEWHFDGGTAQWVRHLVPRRYRIAMWRLYGLACKRYDSVAGEWDVAMFLNYSIAGPFILEEYGMPLPDNESVDAYDNVAWQQRPPHPFFHKGDYELSPPSPLYEAPTGLDAITPSQSMQQSVDAERSPTPISSTAPQGSINTKPLNRLIVCQQEVPNTVGFIEVLLCFHAFRWGSSDITPPRPSQRLSIDDACKAVGFYLPEYGTRSFEVQPERASKFIAWVSCMLNKKTTPPCDWWWLHPESQDRLKYVLLSKNYPLRLSVMRNAEDEKLWWCLHKQSGPTPWFIAVEDPTAASAAVQSRRSWDNVGKWMVASGLYLLSFVS